MSPVARASAVAWASWLLIITADAIGRPDHGMSWCATITVVFGLLSVVGSPPSRFLAGIAGGFMAGPLLRLAWEQDGPVAACLGFALAAAAMATVVLTVEDEARPLRPMTPREAALLLWLATTCASVLGLPLADLVAWLAGVLA